MRLGKKEASGYVADIETDETLDAAVIREAPRVTPAAEPVAREPEQAAAGS